MSWCSRNSSSCPFLKVQKLAPPQKNDSAFVGNKVSGQHIFFENVYFAQEVWKPIHVFLCLVNILIN